MPYTIAQAIDEIRQRVRDASGILLPTTQITRLLNDGCAEYSRDTSLLRFNKPYSLTDTTGEVAIPECTPGTNPLLVNATIIKLMYVLWDTSTSSGQYVWIPEVPYETLLANAYGNWTKQSQPLMYAIEHEATDASAGGATLAYAYRKIFLWPRPLSPGSRLRFIGTRTHTWITESTTTTMNLEFSPELHEGPIAWAEWKALQRDGRDTVARLRKQDYYELVQKGLKSRVMTEKRNPTRGFDYIPNIDGEDDDHYA